jgi:virginiamycin B lyase
MKCSFRLGRELRFLLFTLFLTLLFISPSSIFAKQKRRRAVFSAEKRQMADLKVEATFVLGGDPDWMAVAEDAVWVTTSSLNRVTRLDAATNTAGISITVQNPCSGLIAGYGSLWIPSCADRTLIRANLETGKIEATIAAPPADSEGCIAVGAGGVWLATSKKGTLSRIDPQTNTVIASIPLPSGSYCPVFADNFIWVTSFDRNVLTKVDPASNSAIVQIRVGKRPRFAAAGAGAVWTLNQGDGTISRVNTSDGKLGASISAGLKGHGGEITFGFGSVWPTLTGTPVSRIDAIHNTIIRQWRGEGGDSIRSGFGSIWLTSLKTGVVWRISPDNL